MGATILIGSQWGDEGKGKIIDVLTSRADWVVRYQGGNNAGHTVEVGAEQYILHLIPSGILHAGKRCVIGHGMVVDPLALCEEIGQLEQRGIEMEGRLFISDRAHVVMPYHRLLDAGLESKLAVGEKIGTTQRGIGPAYAAKITRTGLRYCDLLANDVEDLMRRAIERNNASLAAMGAQTLDVDAELARLMPAVAKLRPLVADTIIPLNAAIKAGEKVLFEGAQGTMLDIDYGSYPFVTSSSCTAGGAIIGTGVAPQRIAGVLGVLKAYTTRVGEGPMPTELHDEMGETLRSAGGEFGATTGRPRRCGWFDAVIARYSAMVSGIDRWALTKLDVLDKLENIKICVAYELDGRRIETVPARSCDLERCVPIYEEMEGWQTPISAISDPAQLPAQARAYIARLEQLTGVKAGILSLGPNRASTIVLEGGLFD
jgi:adenylosuccinate synthase